MTVMTTTPLAAFVTVIEHHLCVAQRVLADSWELLRQGAFTALQSEGRLPRLPDLSFEGAQRNAAEARALLRRVDTASAVELPHPVAVALRQARYQLVAMSKQGEWYWLVIDPGCGGFFGMFAPTSYCCGYLLNLVFQSAQKFSFNTLGDTDRYLASVRDVSCLIDQMTARTIGQRERGILIPKPQLSAVRRLVGGLRVAAATALRVESARLSAAINTQRPGFNIEVEQRLHNEIDSAFERLAMVLDGDYETQAPESVGMGQYPGGADVYSALVKMHTTLDLTPAEVHNLGVQRIARVQQEMATIRADAGFADDAAAYLARAGADPRFSAQTTEGVTAVFQRYISRIEGAFDLAFFQRPQAPHGVAPLPVTLEASMTFGYYDVPKPDGSGGTYFFNSANLKRQPLLNVASLTFHELVPGHHLHVSLQNENESLHPISRFSFCNAFNEGWAEYAATLAGELGLYEAPEERYGRLIMDAFLTCRLVVDTGMNALGWTLEQARHYMRHNASMAETEVLTESLRYSCDLPAQSLAYKLGDTEMLRLRERMRAARGPHFDLREFHAAVLGFGGMPIPDLEWSIDVITNRLVELTAT
jgi:uncharacterized protein (DUF885 family)